MNEVSLSNGTTVLWEENGVGGRRYYSDECGNGVLVWDTSLVNIDTLIGVFKIEYNLLLSDIDKIIGEI